MVKYYNWIATILVWFINLGYFLPVLYKLNTRPVTNGKLFMVCLMVQLFAILSGCIVLTKQRNSWAWLACNIFCLIVFIILFLFFIKNWQPV